MFVAHLLSQQSQVSLMSRPVEPALAPAVPDHPGYEQHL
jgi:hypothetical protein